MNTRSIAMIAILAVAAVAIVGAGYAYYWGQTEVPNNQVDVEYLAVQTDMASLNIDVDFNTTYVSATNSTVDFDEDEANDAYFTITPTGSTFSTIGGKSVTPITKNQSTGAAVGVPFTVSAPLETDVNSYFLQVTVDNVTIGTNATLYMAVTATGVAPATGDTLYQFYKVDETSKTYVANLPAAALVETSEGSGLYSVTKDAYIYLGESDASTGEGSLDGIQVLDVSTAKCSIDTGKIVFQAMKTAVTGATPTIVAGGASKIEVAPEAMDGFTLSVVYYDDCLTAAAPTVSVNVVNFTAKAAGAAVVTGVMVLQFDSNGITEGGDIFYLIVQCTIPASS